MAASQEQILTTLATDFKNYLQVKPDARLTLTGHADPRGGAEYNKALSERRVGTVKHFLIDQGVPEGSIDTQAMGDEHPLSKDDVKQLVQTNPELTDEERAKIMRNLTVIYLAQNRRVDITLANTGQQSVQALSLQCARCRNPSQREGPGTRQEAGRAEEQVTSHPGTGLP